jgi:signal transduction histidine kinase
MQTGVRVPPRVLVVDDDEDGRESLMVLLRDDGFQVASAPDGDAALALLRDGARPDVILLDLMMPNMDGWQFRVEQKRDPGLASIPVLALSADGSAKAEAIDANGYVSKPYQYPDLLALVCAVVEKDRLSLADRMAPIGALAGGIAHEINNPLTYVLGNLERLQREPPPGLQADAGRRLREAVQGAERIRDIVRRVGLLADSGSGRPTVVDVQRVLDTSIDLVRTEVERRARIVKEYSPTPFVVATAGQLAQLFLHLVVNAAQSFEKEDPERNLIRVVSGTSAKGSVLIEVADTGSGVPPEIGHRIFDPFFTTKPVGQATGLGLSICYGIVQGLDGTIGFHCEPDHGSTFRVTLPPYGPGVSSQ